MPSQLNVQISGRIQNVIFYKRGDKYYNRAMPATVKQTIATKKSASVFGKAAKMGKWLREQLVTTIPFPADNNMQTRLVSALLQWLRSDYVAAVTCDHIPMLSSFSFTPADTVRKRWRVNMQVTHSGEDMLQLIIPAFVPSKSMQAPAGTVLVTCKIAAAVCNASTGLAMGSFSTSIDYEYNDIEVPEQIINLPVPTSAGSLALTTMYLEYYSTKNNRMQLTTKKAFIPAGVVDAKYF